jgi:hypothetical protein
VSDTNGNAIDGDDGAEADNDIVELQHGGSWLHGDQPVNRGSSLKVRVLHEYGDSNVYPEPSELSWSNSSHVGVGTVVDAG